jgi:hypothetical protein
VAATVGLTDTGSSTDAVAAGVPISVSDSATASDALSVTVTLTLVDTAAGADSPTAAVTAAVSDTAAASDTLAVVAQLALAESAATLDALGLTAAAPLADTGTAVDALTHQQLGGPVSITLTDAATATDRFGVSVAVGRGAPTLASATGRVGLAATGSTTALATRSEVNTL